MQEQFSPSQKQKMVKVNKKRATKPEKQQVTTPTRPVTRSHPAKKVDDIYESGSKFSPSYKGPKAAAAEALPLNKKRKLKLRKYFRKLTKSPFYNDMNDEQKSTLSTYINNAKNLR